MSASAKFQNTLHQLSKIETKERLFLKFFFFLKNFYFFIFILFLFFKGSDSDSCFGASGAAQVKI
jgi:hypothetical protein